MKAKGFIPTLAVLASSLTFLSGCSTGQVSQRMLDVRSEYDTSNYIPNLALKESGNSVQANTTVSVPARSLPKIAVIRIHQQEMPDHAYFWGGWVSIEIDQPQWVLTKMTPIRITKPAENTKSKKIQKTNHATLK